MLLPKLLNQQQRPVRLRRLVRAKLDGSHGPSTEANLGLPREIAEAWTKLNEVATMLRTVIRGKADVIDLVLTSLLAEGSILLEDVPGVGKTTMAKSVSKLIDLEYQRIQCTPDLLPSDILGGSIYRPAIGEF